MSIFQNGFYFLMVFFLLSLPIIGIAQEASEKNEAKSDVPDLSLFLDRATSLLTLEEREELNKLRSKLSTQTEKIQTELTEKYGQIDKQTVAVLEAIENKLFEKEYKDGVDAAIPLDKRTKTLTDKIIKRFNTVAGELVQHSRSQTELRDTDFKNEKVQEAAEAELKRLGLEEKRLQQERQNLNEVMNFIQATESSAKKLRTTVLEETQNKFLEANEAKLKDKALLMGRVIEALMTEAKARQWNDSFAEFGTRVHDAKTRIVALEQSLDNALVGVYVRTKFQRMLNGDVLCRAVKNCAAKPEDQQAQSAESLFHNEKGKARGTRSNDKVAPKTHGPETDN